MATTWAIKAHLAVYTKNNGKPGQFSGCAILLNANMSDGTAATRTITNVLGDKNQAQAELYTAIAAITAIQLRSRVTKVTLYTNSKYLVTVLTKKNGEWGEVNKNKGLVHKLRETYDQLKDAGIEFDNTSGEIARASELAKTCCQEQASTDTGTTYGTTA